MGDSPDPNSVQGAGLCSADAWNLLEMEKASGGVGGGEIQCHGICAALVKILV